VRECGTQRTSALNKMPGFICGTYFQNDNFEYLSGFVAVRVWRDKHRGPREVRDVHGPEGPG